MERDFEWDLEDLLRDLAELVPPALEPPGDLRGRIRRVRTRSRRWALGVMVAASAFVVALRGRE